MTYLRHGAIILEPEPKTDPGPERTYRLMLCVRGGINHIADASSSAGTATRRTRTGLPA
jgi:hypothetical protein